ncbi:MAG: ABC transporter permease [Deltaproteobacteria bacterium]|nr:ABC transporter permease [Deltaproteobacteria bacterium]
MRATLLRYSMRRALANMSENRLVHLIGIGTMAIAFLIFDAFLLVFLNINYWIEEQGSSLTMSIYFTGDPDKAAVETVSKELLQYPGVTINEFISKSDAMENLKRRLGDKAGLLDGLEGNPLPASLEITLSKGKIEDFPKQLKARLEMLEAVDEVQYSHEWVEKIQAVMGAVKLIGIIFGGLLFLAALFIIINTIKLAIYSRHDEVEILKLVGATNRFVKAPFLIEGSIQGFLGGVTAIVILLLGYLVAITRIDLRIGFASFDIVFLSPQFILLLLLMSIIVGFLGSMISLSRFFRI